MRLHYLKLSDEPSKVDSLISRRSIWGDVSLFIEFHDWAPLSVCAYVSVCICPWM